MYNIKLLCLFLLLVLSCCLNAESLTIEGDFSFSENIEDRIRKAIDQFQVQMGLYPEFNIRIVVIPEKQAVRDLDVSRKLIENSNAFYSRKDKVIYFQSDKIKFSDSSVRTLLHEYIHQFIDYYWPDAPLWFHEGMAQFYATGSDFNSAVDFSRMKLFGQELNLIDMERNYPENTALWGAFYFKSYIIVKHIANHRKNNFYRFLDASYPGCGFSKTFYRTFLTAKDIFCREMDDIADRKASAYILLSVSMMIPIIFPVLNILAWIIKTVRYRRKLKEWEIIEEKDSEETAH